MGHVDEPDFDPTGATVYRHERKYFVALLSQIFLPSLAGSVTRTSSPAEFFIVPVLSRRGHVTSAFHCRRFCPHACVFDYLWRHTSRPICPCRRGARPRQTARLFCPHDFLEAHRSYFWSVVCVVVQLVDIGSHFAESAKRVFGLLVQVVIGNTYLHPRDLPSTSGERFRLPHHPRDLPS